ncbi:phosphotransferase [Priestia abyssalis]|uniref:phosphotransferase n=1 Tax=Priestia abyssalis TaxID=1221450 RepID=UPI000994ADBB|nr:phosphotransferase [Priestia abyssalis]
MEPKNSKTLMEVLQEYDLSKEDVTFIKEAKEGKVWIINDTKNKQWLVLKSLNKKKTLFPIMLHSQLSEAGFAVPKVLKTTSGQAYIQKKKDYYYLCEYINHLEKINELQRIEALAYFHVHAKSAELMSFNEKIQFPTKENFLASYSSKLDELEKWASAVSSSLLKDAMKEMKQLGFTAYTLIQNCDIEAYLQHTSNRYTICHGDFNSNNALITEKGDYYIIDFDRAYFGPPLEDFRFLMMSLTRNFKHDPNPRLALMFEHYFNIYTEDLNYKEIYRIDSMFPHEFYKQVNEKMEQGKGKKLAKHEEVLLQVAEREKRKYDWLIEGSERP